VIDLPDAQPHVEVRFGPSVTVLRRNELLVVVRSYVLSVDVGPDLEESSNSAEITLSGLTGTQDADGIVDAACRWLTASKGGHVQVRSRETESQRRPDGNQ
jgi:hypothetical protein